MCTINHSPASFLPLPATPTLSSPLHQLTLEIIKFDINGVPLTRDDSGLPTTPTLPSPPYTPLLKSKEIDYGTPYSPSSPTFSSSPPKTPLLKYHKPIDKEAEEMNTPSQLPSTPTLSSPPFTPMIKSYHRKPETPMTPDDNSFTLPQTPTLCSPTFTTLLQAIEAENRTTNGNNNDIETESIQFTLPATPTLSSPTFTPLITYSKDALLQPLPFNPSSPLPSTPTFTSPPYTPAVARSDAMYTYAENLYSTPISTPTMSSPLHTPGCALHTPLSPSSPSYQLLHSQQLSTSLLDSSTAAWKL